MQLLEARTLAAQDPELYAAIANEERRQRDNLELIASENYASQAVREATASVMTNKYAANATTAFASSSTSPKRSQSIG